MEPISLAFISACYFQILFKILQNGALVTIALFFFFWLTLYTVFFLGGMKSDTRRKIPIQDAK